MNGIERPAVIDKNDPRHFSIKTGGVKAYKSKADDGSDQYFIEGTASSSVTDRYGDILTEACQASMLNQAKGLTMWLNHSYQVPEDIAGVCVCPTLVRSMNGSDPCLDLDIKLSVDHSNPRALRSWQAVQNGTQLAFSIGGYFTDFDLELSNDMGLVVNDVSLLEISLVGIPANPRAYTKAFETATEPLRKAIVTKMKLAQDGGLSPQEARCQILKSFGLSAGEVEVSEPVIESNDPIELAAEDAALLAAIADPDEQCATEPETAEVEVDAALDAPEAEAPATVTTQADLEATLALEEQKIAAERLDKLSSDVAALEATKADLERKIAELQATPTGRSTKSSNPGGSSKGSEPTIPIELYYKNRQELREASAAKHVAFGRDSLA